MFDEREFLDAAHVLRLTDTREGFQRSAVSRAYYAVFLHARRICREKRWLSRTGSGSDHGAVASRLSEIDARLGHDFRELQSLRRTADYTERELGIERSADDAQLALDLAEQVRTRLEHLG
jgi:uncharacterized protein (UPF0332 family)